jgi:hypothetical protein
LESRRKFLKRGLYVTPVIMSLAVRPAMAGQAYRCEGGKPNHGQNHGFSFLRGRRGRGR